ncbi:hypothetical protein Sjap_022744 [Stephania japonica]|uniref:Uncharacterized protein n=1 Tax=Stephania japonica TaxID=461633 RepID=A0AAP0EUU9_9MAGN
MEGEHILQSPHNQGHEIINSYHNGGHPSKPDTPIVDQLQKKPFANQMMNKDVVFAALEDTYSHFSQGETDAIYDEEHATDEAKQREIQSRLTVLEESVEELKKNKLLFLLSTRGPARLFQHKPRADFPFDFPPYSKGRFQQGMCFSRGDEPTESEKEFDCFSTSTEPTFPLISLLTVGDDFPPYNRGMVSKFRQGRDFNGGEGVELEDVEMWIDGMRFSWRPSLRLQGVRTPFGSDLAKSIIAGIIVSQSTNALGIGLNALGDLA